MNLSLYILYYFVILSSIVGYGIFFHRIFFYEERINYGYCGLFGIFALTIILYLTSFIVAHNLIFNFSIILIGILFIVYHIKGNSIELKKDLIILFLIFVFLLQFIFSAKTHDDFSYYHFPYIHLLTQDLHFYGIGNFNHGFRTPSSIFYLSSLLYLPKINYDLIHIVPVFFLGFVNFVLIKDIIKEIKLKKLSHVLYFSLLNFSLINIFFYRLSEHGTDKSAQILILLIVSNILIYLINNIKDPFRLNKILILTFLTVSLKVFYLINLLLLIPILLIQKKKIDFVINIFCNKIFIICLFFLLIIFGINIINTGCIIYPLSISCFESIPWSIQINEVKQMNEWYQLWSKAGATPEFRISEPNEYIRNFNWLTNWIELYFFNKVLDYILGILFLGIIFIFIFKKKNFFLKKINFNKNILLVYAIIFFLFLEWFYNHPALRYGGYHLIAILIFLPLSFYLEKISFYDSINKKKIGYLFLLILVIVTSRNIIRIEKEVNLYNYNIYKNPSYNSEFKNIEIFNNVMTIKNCIKEKNEACKNQKIKGENFFNSVMFYRDK